MYRVRSVLLYNQKFAMELFFETSLGATVLSCVYVLCTKNRRRVELAICVGWSGVGGWSRRADRGVGLNGNSHVLVDVKRQSVDSNF